MPAIVASAESTAEETTETANVYTRANVNSSLRKVKSLFSLKSGTALHESIPAPAPELQPHRTGPIGIGEGEQADRQPVTSRLRQKSMANLKRIFKKLN